MSLTYFLNDLEMVPVAPIITGITLVFTFHMSCIIIIIIIITLVITFSKLFTIMYLKQTMFLRYRVLQLFCIYSLGCL